MVFCFGSPSSLRQTWTGRKVSTPGKEPWKWWPREERAWGRLGEQSSPSASQSSQSLVIRDTTGKADWGQIMASHGCQNKAFGPDPVGLRAQSTIISGGEEHDQSFIINHLSNMLTLTGNGGGGLAPECRARLHKVRQRVHVSAEAEPGGISAYSGCQSPSRWKHPLCGAGSEHLSSSELSSRIAPCPTAVLRDQDKGKA